MRPAFLRLPSRTYFVTGPNGHPWPNFHQQPLRTSATDFLVKLN